MNRFITFSVGLWIFSIPFKNALFELSSAWLIGITALIVLANRARHTTKEIPKLPPLLAVSFVSIAGALLLSNYLGRQTSIGYWISAHFLVRYGGAFACIYYLYFQGYLTTRAIYNAIIISLFMQACLGVLQFFTHFDYVRDKPLLYGKRLYGGTFNPNPYGFLMAIGASLCSWRLFQRLHGHWSKACFYLVLLALFMATLLLSGSRSSWIMYVVFLAIIGFVSSHMKLSHIAATLTLSALTTASLYWLFPSVQQVIERAFLMDTSNRLDIWQTTWSFILEQPWLGYGAGNFSQLTGMVYASVHNSVLEILLFTGVVGLVGFSALCYTLLTLAKQSQSPGLFAMVLAVLCASLFDHSVIDSKIFLTTSALLAALTAIAWAERQRTLTEQHP